MPPIKRLTSSRLNPVGYKPQLQYGDQRGRGLDNLPLPLAIYRVDLASPASDDKAAFETLDKSLKEDATRSKRLRRAVEKHPDALGSSEPEQLLRKLELAGHDNVPDTIASSRHMRWRRIICTGAVWKLFVDTSRRGRTVTIIPKTWEASPADLLAVDPVKHINRLRSDLYKKGAAAAVKAGGWAIGCIHGEFDPVAQVYRLHIHLLADPKMMRVILRLKKLPNYATKKHLKDGTLSPVYRRIRRRKKKMYDVSYLVSYIFQSFWPSRPVKISEDGQTRTRGRTKGRMGEPFHSLSLLWLDKRRLADLTLMVGLRVTSQGLVRTQRKR